MSEMFLSRKIFDVQRNGWVFADGSGFRPDEMRIDIESQYDGGWFEGLRALSTKIAWDQRLAQLRAETGI